jgi:hypothetical protein
MLAILANLVGTANTVTSKLIGFIHEAGADFFPYLPNPLEAATPFGVARTAVDHYVASKGSQNRERRSLCKAVFTTLDACEWEIKCATARRRFLDDFHVACPTAVIVSHFAEVVPD